MGQKEDTINIQLISSEYKVYKKNDNIIVIEQKEKSEGAKELYENPVFISFVFPLVLILISFFIARWWFRKKEQKEKEKLDFEVSKLDEEIKQIKSSFQPIVLATIQSTQDKLLQDKIIALKEVVAFRIKLYTIKQFYINGKPFISDTDQYYNSIYQNVNSKMQLDMEKIVSEKAYLFPDDIQEKMNLILFEIGEICNIQGRESSIQNMNIPDDAKEKVSRLADVFESVIKLIRENLHINDSFVDDFIEKYKDLGTK